MRRLPRTIDKPVELLGFRMDEIAVFVATLVIFLIINFFFTGLVVSGLLLAFLRGTRRGRPEGYVLHLVYRVMGRRVGTLLPARVGKLSG